MHANIPVDIGYRRHEVESTDTNTHRITIDTDHGERFINAFALKDGAVDYSTEILIPVSGSFSVQWVDFTAPDTDARLFVVVMLGGGLPSESANP
jgi:hypothetical protein